MIAWTHGVLGVLYTCVLYFCICTCSAQLSMFHMERRSTNTLIISITIIITYCYYLFIISQKYDSTREVYPGLLHLRWTSNH